MEIIIEDKRAIERIEIFSSDARDIMSYRAVEKTKIEAYYESGEMGSIVWFAVIKNGVVIARVNSRFVSVVDYKE